MALKVPSQYSRGICKSLIFDIKSNSGANYKLLVLLLLLKLAILINGPIIKSYFEWISTVWTHRSSSVFWQYPKTTHIWKATQFYFVRYLSMHLIQCGDHFSGWGSDYGLKLCSSNSGSRSILSSLESLNPEDHFPFKECIYCFIEDSCDI